MTRWILILALVVAGTAPGAICLKSTAGVGSPIAADDACGMVCCETACCCVAQPEPTAHPSPDVPATPPRSADVLPVTLHVSAPVYELEPAADPGRTLALLFSEARFNGREAVETEPLLCRWLT
ncbi:MAG: hypothetical protein AAF333_18510 [Planctomycetota bacterium]